MTNNYVVLRSRVARGTRDPFGGGAFSIGLRSLGAAHTELVDAELETVTLTPSDVVQLSRDPSVSGIAPVMPIVLHAPVAISAVGSTWGLDAIGATTSPFDGSGVRVAILDTGIASNHTAFVGVNLIEKDFTGTGDGDTHGHGTHCAGVAFGRDVNGKRIGVARGVTDAMIGKVLDGTGRGSTDGLYRALNWALEGGARVISMSLGYDFPKMQADLEMQGFPAVVATSMTLEAYRQNLRIFDGIMSVASARVEIDGGAGVVAATGNESARPTYEIGASMPAVANHVISVGAVSGPIATGLYDIASFSNIHPAVVGPGVDVLSAAHTGGLVSMSGTSMATPHVAGIFAMWWQAAESLGLPRTSTAVRIAGMNADC